MILPNFLVIGAAKAGTTSLYYYLRQHPEVFMSNLKEPHFFSFEGEELNFRRAGNLLDPINETAITDLSDYYSLFKDVSTEKAVGEASPSYLHTPKAADRIKFYIPHAKLIAILRHPVDRAYSAFLGQYLNGVEKGTPYLSDFSEALNSEEQFIRENWTPIFFYKKLGFYYEQLKYYYDVFPKSQIHICLNEDLQKYPLKTLQQIYHHIEVDPSFVPDTSMKAGVSGVPKNQALYRFLKQDSVKKLLKPILPKGIGQRFEKQMLNKPRMSEGVRRELLDLYHDDILKLQDLIDRDLSFWLQ